MMKRIFIVATALILTACETGFRPMHAPASALAPAMQDLQIVMENGNSVTDREAGFHIQQRLLDRIGSAGSGPVLTITPNYSRARLGITAEDIATRYDVNLAAEYILRDAKGVTLDTGRVTSVSTFNAPDDPYGVIAANDSSLENAAKDLADRVLNKVAIYYARQK